MLRLLTEAMSPSWSPVRAALRIVEYAGGDVAVLRRARARLLSTGDSDGPIHARALASISVALSAAELAGEQRAGPGDGG